MNELSTAEVEKFIEQLLGAMDRDTSFRSSQSGAAWPRIKDYIRSLQASNKELEKKLRVCREALEVCKKEAHQHYRGDEFTEANDHFRNCYLYASRALASLES